MMAVAAINTADCSASLAYSSLSFAAATSLHRVRLDTQQRAFCLDRYSVSGAQHQWRVLAKIQESIFYTKEEEGEKMILASCQMCFVYFS